MIVRLAGFLGHIIASMAFITSSAAFWKVFYGIDFLHCWKLQFSFAHQLFARCCTNTSAHNGLFYEGKGDSGLVLCCRGSIRAGSRWYLKNAAVALCLREAVPEQRALSYCLRGTCSHCGSSALRDSLCAVRTFAGSLDLVLFPASGRY